MSRDILMQPLRSCTAQNSLSEPLALHEATSSASGTAYNFLTNPWHCTKRPRRPLALHKATSSASGTPGTSLISLWHCRKLPHQHLAGQTAALGPLPANTPDIKTGKKKCSGSTAAIIIFACTATPQSTAALPSEPLSDCGMVPPAAAQPCLASVSQDGEPAALLSLPMWITYHIPPCTAAPCSTAAICVVRALPPLSPFTAAIGAQLHCLKILARSWHGASYCCPALPGSCLPARQLPHSSCPCGSATCGPPPLQARPTRSRVPPGRGCPAPLHCGHNQSQSEGANALRDGEEWNSIITLVSYEHLLAPKQAAATGTQPVLFCLKNIMRPEAPQVWDW
eukprot:1162151-Pelagomonas_calceolata.AAC.18